MHVWGMCMILCYFFNQQLFSFAFPILIALEIYMYTSNNKKKQLMISVQNLHMINNQYMYFVCTFLWWIILIIHAPTINVHALFQLNVSAFEALHDVFIVCDIKKRTNCLCLTSGGYTFQIPMTSQSESTRQNYKCT